MLHVRREETLRAAIAQHVDLVIAPVQIATAASSVPPRDRTSSTLADPIHMTPFGAPAIVDATVDAAPIARYADPLAMLAILVPTPPDNLWGGLLGYCLGTHAQSGCPYTGGNCFIDALRLECYGDLHEEDEWREAVHNFLDNRPASRQVGTDVDTIGNALIAKVHVPFAEHELVASSFEDYSQNLCWICQCDSEHWDVYECKHCFCSKCATEMLSRQMPCPLCRKSSTCVKRGLRYGSSGLRYVGSSGLRSVRCA